MNDDDDDGIDDVYTMINYKDSLFVFSNKVTVIIFIIIIAKAKIQFSCHRNRARHIHPTGIYNDGRDG